MIIKAGIISHMNFCQNPQLSQFAKPSKCGNE